MPEGTLHAILKQAGIEQSMFLKRSEQVKFNTRDPAILKLQVLGEAEAKIEVAE